MNYYNEFDPGAAAWLRELIADGLIPPGDVDERSIRDVRADDLLGYKQCHFFAGVGGWDYALQLAGWPEDKPVWTGSCPCQSFSTAGKQKGFDDERDLWPVFAKLIAECRPEYVFGEQVENAIRHGWIDRVYADLERESYTVGAVVLGAHSVGSPHRRQRLYWGAVRLVDSARNGNNGIASNFHEKNGRSERGQMREPASDGNVYVRLAENTDGRGCGGRNHGDSGGYNRKVQTPGLCDGVSISDSEYEQYKRSLSGSAIDTRAQGSGEAAESTGCGSLVSISDTSNNGLHGSCKGAGGTVGSGEQGRMCKPEGESDVRSMDDIESNGRGILDSENIGAADGKIDTPPNASHSGNGLGDSACHEQQRNPLSGTHGERVADRRSGGDVGLANNSFIGITAGVSGQDTWQKGNAGEFIDSSISGLSPWSDFRLIYCRDGKVRRIPAESLLFSVADGISEEMDGGGVICISEDGGFPLTTQKEGRAMLLKGYGNAIVPQVAAAFIKAFMECVKEVNEQ